jgi:hypothetical protein
VPAPARPLTAVGEPRRRPAFPLPAGIRPNPPGWRAEDFTGAGSLAAQGFVPLSEAAVQLGLREDEVLELARTGKLEAAGDGPTVHVRPAIVTVLGVRRRGADG